MDDVFRALADPTRRELLDELFRQDGQTLSGLEEHFSMSRFGVMKHLRLLEEAGLVVTLRQGREKLHYLNPVPIRLVHDRWVSKYAEPLAAGLVDLKHNLESTMEKIFEIYIRTTPERLWAAITDPDDPDQVPLRQPHRVRLAGGVGLRADQPRCPVSPGRGQEPRGRSAPPSGADDDRPVERRRQGRGRVVGHVGDRAVGDSCRLLLIHDQLPDDACEEVYGGWPQILSGLKTWLETGEVLTTPGSLMYT